MIAIDTQEVVKHLDALDASDDSVTLQFVAEAPSAERAFNRHIHVHKRNMFPIVTSRQHLGCAVHLLVNKGDGLGRRIENITHLRAIWQDCDTPQALESTPEDIPSLVVETSVGKLHRYWILEEPAIASEENVALWKTLMHHLVTRHFSDPQAVDISRVLRLAGTWHLKGTPQLVRVTQNTGYRFSLEQLAESWLGQGYQAVVKQRVETERVARNGLVQWQEWLDDRDMNDLGLTPIVLRSDEQLFYAQQIVSAENIHGSVIRLAASLVSRGVSGQQTYQLLDHLLQQCSPEVRASQRWIDRHRALHSNVKTALFKYGLRMNFSVNQLHLPKAERKIYSYVQS